jgi:sugar lactone lactonase YvrE
MKPECVLAAEAVLGEGPVWCDRRQALFWVDISSQRLHRFVPEKESDKSVQLPSTVGSLALTESDQLLVALKGGLSVLDFDSEKLTPWIMIEELKGNRLNDGKCDHAGDFWVGSMSLSEEKRTGCLYRVKTNGDTSKMLDRLIISNGIGWSPNQKKMYHADSGDCLIRVFDFDPEQALPSNPRVFLNASPRGGVPDGLCVDADGCIWVAFWDGSCVIRFMPDGRIDQIVELPVPRPTCVTFGGPKLDTLYVTTARVGLNPERLFTDWKHSGGLFAIRIPFASGNPTSRFELQPQKPSMDFQ